MRCFCKGKAVVRNTPSFRSGRGVVLYGAYALFARRFLFEDHMANQEIIDMEPSAPAGQLVTQAWRRSG